MRTSCKISAALGVILLCRQAAGISVEFRQQATPYNLQSGRGVPISTTAGTPPGSDGRMPLTNESGTTGLPQLSQCLFGGFVSFGAIPGLSSNDWVSVSNSVVLKGGTQPFSAEVAQLMHRPVALSNATVVMILRYAQVGAPYFNQPLSFPFGSMVAVPQKDENSLPITSMPPANYWLPEPYTVNGHQDARYYWSPNARAVFAAQSGPMEITWKKAHTYTASTLPNYTNLIGISSGVPSFETNGLTIYLLYTEKYVVSSSPVKPPRKMYWTQYEFSALGKPIAIPSARVGGVAIAYNSEFPRNVAEEYHGPGYTAPTEGTGYATLQELRTLWYDQSLGYIYAYNVEGRVFLELLGDTHPDGQTREHIGFEIVDVFKQPDPIDITSDLGEMLTPPPPGDIATLQPAPIQQGTGGPTFAYTRTVNGTDRKELYATRVTVNQNDYLVHWMEEGEQRVLWPRYLARYNLIWPTDISRYSIYIRPPASTQADAQATAVPLSTDNVPNIDYQDPLDRPRAELTSDFKFFTWLDAGQPAHRTLLRFGAGDNVAFERVFSLLDSSLKAPAGFVGSLAEELTAWDPENKVFHWIESLTSPRVEQLAWTVGSRIRAPMGEMGSSDTYLAGFINQSLSKSFDPSAYINPFTSGFEAANLGAIIPVNAIPGANLLEVWWFRPNSRNAGVNAGNALLGFKTIYWPSAICQYTLEWPGSVPPDREIVLASNKGSGPLDSYQALGRIYTQNNPSEVGYNPNEEHALMSGGTAYALRDDLNITNGPAYSSHPFVLVRYTAEDNRPAITAFKVLRENPEAGYVFDYITTAGQLLQPPMPLAVMQKPVEGTGDSARNYNTEPLGDGEDLPVNWTANDAKGAYKHYQQFTYSDRKHQTWVYRGVHAGLPLLEAGQYDTNLHKFITPPDATAIAGKQFRYVVHASRQTAPLKMEGLTIPAWLHINGLTLEGTPAAADVKAATTYTVKITDSSDGNQASVPLNLTVAASGDVVAQVPLVIACTNSYTGTITSYSDRAPFLAFSPGGSNSFTMRFYYKTLADFAWPSDSTPPAPGSIVPYLRRYDPNEHQYVGEPDSSQTASLDIVYRPVWPQNISSLPLGATLTVPWHGLPGVSDMKTARLYYQQSIATNIANPKVSAVLHDPTRQKYSLLVDHQMEALPGSVQTDSYQGRYYFPTLPPHLANRLYYDPNRGALVLQGELRKEITGDSYLLLNVLRGADLDAAKALCLDDDPMKQFWDNTVTDLITEVETFHENPEPSGPTYVPDEALTRRVSVQDLAEVNSENTAVDSYALSATGPAVGYITLLEATGTAFTQPGDPVAIHIFRVGPDLYGGQIKALASDNPLSELLTFQHTADLAGRFSEYDYEWLIAPPVGGAAPPIDEKMASWQPLASGRGIPSYTLGGAGIQALCDNYVVMRYKPTNSVTWPQWTQPPTFAPGWIKRVLAGINPFNQRTSDLFNNRANTDVSMLTQAGHRWEGDVALNSDTLNDYGLIEIYETILHRGRMLSIDSGYNYGPANDALLLVAGYLNDLYMMEGNEALADAMNPTIGIGTKDKTYGEIATALFSFQGQVPSLLEENLALLRGRDDFLQPGVETQPIYNRLVWNYTEGIASGQTIYALNYDIQENPDKEPDGVVDETDAAYLYPQGHGDAYGHYLTALKGYYSLLLNSYFDWVPRPEAASVLGMAIQVDYQDERKFAATAAALARAGEQIFKLTWRRDYQPVRSVGWKHFAASSVNNDRRVPTTQYWGMDHWAARTGQGAYLNWVIGNAMLPTVDDNPAHRGVQKIDRTTVPELEELTAIAQALQTAMDGAEGALSPLGVPEDGLAFDLNPAAVAGTDNGTHFEQVYQRAKVALNNAVVAFDDAKDVTRLMRSEQDSLADFQSQVLKQEMAFTNALIELYGTPYPDDIGPGKTYKQNYAGPDLLHYMYVDLPEKEWPDLWNYKKQETFRIDLQDLPKDWLTTHYVDFDFYQIDDTAEDEESTYSPTNYWEFTIGNHGFFGKPEEWTTRRYSPGKIQQAISKVIAAHDALRSAMWEVDGGKDDLDKAVGLFNAEVATHEEIHEDKRSLLIQQQAGEAAKLANELVVEGKELSRKFAEHSAEAAEKALPSMTIAGMAFGGDLVFGARFALATAKAATVSAFDVAEYIANFAIKTYEFGIKTEKEWVELEGIGPLEWHQDLREKVAHLGEKLISLQGKLWVINEKLRALDDAQREYQAVLAQANRLQAERLTFRQRSAAVVQGYRTRDAAFRFFRDEKLERYNTLFELASRYALLAANAYDYETGLLDTSAGRSFVRRIVNSQALGIVRNGEPQYAGSNMGDPGLSSALAEMKADWDVLRGRLGFNNPDAYGTTVSLRTECLRILPGPDGDAKWLDSLNLARRDNLLDDEDIRRYCLQVDTANGVPVPGIVLTFSTTIADGHNLFGQQLAAGDHAFSPSSFATKVFGVGVAFTGYRGMDDPTATSGTTTSSPPDPSYWYLDPLALSATPYVYLIPVGIDSMRTPPLGDASRIRTWTVQDVAIPMPFNIGASDFSTKQLWQSSQSLTEPLFEMRKHQAFRPVSNASLFRRDLYGPTGTLLRSQYTNNRLVGRSVWNSQWKLVIPGKTLLNDPKEGLDRFLQTVKDIQLHFVTYSYSGN